MITKNPASAQKVNKFKKYARDVIAHFFGSGARRIEFKSSGLTNFVFDVKHAEGNFVLRISPEAARLDSFMKEQWAQKAALQVGVPVSEILEVGAEVIPHPYMISTTVEGREATQHPKRFEILTEMGCLAAKINTIGTNGFGETFDWSENQLSRNASFGEYLQSEYRYGEKIRLLEKHKLLSSTHARKLRRIFRSAESIRRKPVLNHGDLRLKNVIVDDDGRINAIIDWGECVSNIAPEWDLSIALHDLGIDGMQHFLAGYGIKGAKLNDVMPLVKAFNVTNYAGAVDDAVKAKDKVRLDQYRVRLSGILDLYSF